MWFLFPTVNTKIDYNELKRLKSQIKRRFVWVAGSTHDNEEMQAVEVHQELSKKYKNILTIVQSSPIYLEITDINASKGKALDFLKEYWNLKDEEVIASGDQDNDIDLLLHAGLKVCVGNNSKKLKEISQYHCSSVKSNELVNLIESLML